MVVYEKIYFEAYTKKTRKEKSIYSNCLFDVGFTPRVVLLFNITLLAMIANSSNIYSLLCYFVHTR